MCEITAPPIVKTEHGNCHLAHDVTIESCGCWAEWHRNNLVVALFTCQGCMEGGSGPDEENVTIHRPVVAA